MTSNLTRRLTILFLLLCVCNTLTESAQNHRNKINQRKLLLFVLTTNEEVTQELHRFGSQHHYDIPFKMLSRQKSVSGIESENELQLLEMELKNQLGDSENVIIVSKSFDLIFNDEPNEILERFYQSGARVIFSLDKLISQYPPKDDGHNLFNVRLIIVYNLFEAGFYTQIYKTILPRFGLVGYDITNHF